MGRLATALVVVAALAGGCVTHPDDEAPAAPSGEPAAPLDLGASPPDDAVAPEADEPDDDASTDPEGDEPDDDDAQALAEEEELAAEEAVEGTVAAADIVLDPGEATSVDEVMPPVARRGWVRHRRADRERLEQIAFRYGVTAEELREDNDLSPDTVDLKRGARLRVKARRTPPPREKLRYEIVEGDTWHSVALRHGVDERDLRAYNWPYKGKMAPGKTLQIWIDPIVRDWIAAGADPVEVEAAGGVHRGGIGIGPPDEGRLLHGVRIPASSSYGLRLPKSAYGTTHAVTEVVRAFARFDAASDYDRAVELGAMSRARGGEIGTHRSHQTGRDLDVRLPRRKGVSRFAALTPRRVDWVATWQLVQAFAQGDVTVIFLDYDRQKRLYRAAKAAGADETLLSELLQYPRGRAASRGLVRHSEGHVRHMHVRFGCGPYETECVP